MTTKSSVLAVAKGDIVVVRCDRELSQPMHDAIKTKIELTLQAAGHSGVPVLVIDKGISLDIVRVGEQAGWTNEELTRLIAKGVRDNFEIVQRDWERFRA